VATRLPRLDVNPSTSRSLKLVSLGRCGISTFTRMSRGYIRCKSWQIVASHRVHHQSDDMTTLGFPILCLEFHFTQRKVLMALLGAKCIYICEAIYIIAMLQVGWAASLANTKSLMKIQASEIYFCEISQCERAASLCQIHPQDENEDLDLSSRCPKLVHSIELS